MNDFSHESAPAVWLCTSADVTLAEMPDWTTPSENHRLARLSGRPRNDFLACRWLIRRALAAASGRNPRFCWPADGRTHTSAEPVGWRLSLSHSGGLAGCAVSCGTAIGLDIEPLTRRPDWRKVVARWFSPREQTWLLKADDPLAFLKAWTLKEAWLKATGRGIANNLQTLEISDSFELSGDRPTETWRASLGRSGDYLVAVVYQSADYPDGFRIIGQIDINDPETAISGTEPVEWLLHQQIH